MHSRHSALALLVASLLLVVLGGSFASSASEVVDTPSTSSLSSVEPRIMGVHATSHAIRSFFTTSSTGAGEGGSDVAVTSASDAASSTGATEVCYLPPTISCNDSRSAVTQLESALTASAQLLSQNLTISSLDTYISIVANLALYRAVTREVCSDSSDLQCTQTALAALTNYTDARSIATTTLVASVKDGSASDASLTSSTVQSEVASLATTTAQQIDAQVTLLLACTSPTCSSSRDSLDIDSSALSNLTTELLTTIAPTNGSFANIDATSGETLFNATLNSWARVLTEEIQVGQQCRCSAATIAALGSGATGSAATDSTTGGVVVTSTTGATDPIVVGGGGVGPVVISTTGGDGSVVVTETTGGAIVTSLDDSTGGVLSESVGTAAAVGPTSSDATLTATSDSTTAHTTSSESAAARIGLTVAGILVALVATLLAHHAPRLLILV